tara:strand:+ start:1127 stop:1318 length:192 start_codon:yes stop_codon:yes gene_type:complete
MGIFDFLKRTSIINDNGWNKIFTFSDTASNGHEIWVAKKELQNEKGLDKYIDMILTEKAEKKK